MWIDRAQSAEAREKTLRDQMEPMKNKLRDVKAALCAKERSDGSFAIDFKALVDKLPPDQARELRQVIDEKHGGGSRNADLEAVCAEGDWKAILAHLEGKTVKVISAGGELQKPRLRIVANA